MNLVDKLPQMTDDALEVLAENARRLAQADRAPNKSAAEALLPHVEAELTSRRVTKLQRMREAAAARPATTPKRRATKKTA